MEKAKQPESQLQYFIGIVTAFGVGALFGPFVPIIGLFIAGYLWFVQIPLLILPFANSGSSAAKQKTKPRQPPS